MAAIDLRKQVHHIAYKLPPEATCDDVRHQVELHASIERGLVDIEAGRVIPVEELRAESGV